MAVTGVESAVVEEAEWVGLAASQGTSGIKIKVVDVNIAVVVGVRIFWAHEMSFGENFRAFSAKLEHFAHGGVAIDVSVAAFDVRIFGGILDSDGFIDLHEVAF